jgi:hypothetical protein
MGVAGEIAGPASNVGFEPANQQAGSPNPADQGKVDEAIRIDPERSLIDLVQLREADQDLIVGPEFVVGPNRSGWLSWIWGVLPSPLRDLSKRINAHTGQDAKNNKTAVTCQGLA